MKKMTDPRSAHPNDESLVAYLTTGLSDIDRRGIDRHLQDCDLCIESLSMTQRRLSIAAEIPTPVPASLSERVAAVSAPPALASRESRAPWLSPMLDRLSSVFRFPVLVPVAVAAVALLVVVTRSDWMNPVPQRERSRSVTMRERLHVTASEARVWQRPGVRGQQAGEERITATLKRGARVEVIDEKAGWYQVILPDGKEGWMERTAFE